MNNLFNSRSPATTNIYYPQRAQKNKAVCLWSHASNSQHIFCEKQNKKKMPQFFLKTMLCTVFPKFICAWDMKGQTCRDCLLCECFDGLCVVLMLQLFMEDYFNIIWQVLNPAMTLDCSKGVFANMPCEACEKLSECLIIWSYTDSGAVRTGWIRFVYLGGEAQAFSTDPKN